MRIRNMALQLLLVTIFLCIGTVAYAEGTPVGYNSEDYRKLADFAKQKYEDEDVTNQTKLGWEDLSDPTTWNGVKWNEGGAEGKRIVEINIENEIDEEQRLVGTLDLSGCTELVSLDCSNNKLTSLDLSGCTELVSLDCGVNWLESLNLSGCLELSSLFCYGNQLESLDFSNCTKIESVVCFDNNITELNLENSTELILILCGANYITELNLENCEKLEGIDCANNNISELDFENCKGMVFIECSNNKITALDVSECTKLEELRICENDLTEIDISYCPEIKTLVCDDNNLKWINISGCEALEGILCKSNKDLELIWGYSSVVANNNFKLIYDAKKEILQEKEIKVLETDALIIDLPPVEEVSLEDEEKVNEALDAYNTLSDVQKLFASNYNILAAVIDRIAELKLPYIVEITPISGIEVENKTSENDALAALPGTTTIKDSSEAEHNVDLSWVITEYNRKKAGIYNATGSLSLPAGVRQSEPVTELKVFSTVTVKEEKKTSQPSQPSGSGSDRPTPRPVPQPAPSVTYMATVERTNLQDTTLSITVDAAKGNASVDLGELSGRVFIESGNTLVTMPSMEKVGSYTVQFPVDSLSKPIAEGSMEILTDGVKVTLQDNMLSGEEGKQAGITISQVDKANLSDKLKNVVGKYPLVKLATTIEGKETQWYNADASVLISIPYTPTEEEIADSEFIIVSLVDEDGNLSAVTSGRFDSEAGAVTVTVNRSGMYAVSFTHKTFEDLDSVKWAVNPIEVLASKGIIHKLADENYLPQTDITRAEFLYMLVRTLGVDTKTDSSFSDISSDAYYYRELAVAKKLGITNGTGNNMFAPDDNITRQEMMAMTERALRLLNKIEAIGTPGELEDFSDKELVADYAVESVASVVKEGLIVGSGGNINPLGNTTRAETAVLMHRISNKY